MRVYLDNAATTPLDPQVYKAMDPYLKECYGNPSSIHAHGREARSAIEKSRKKVAELLNTSPSEIFFTSGGTEADNMAIGCSVDALGCEHIITSKLEHHAVLHTVENIEKRGLAKVSYLTVDKRGNFDLDELRALLGNKHKTLVTLMQGNNEVGNLVNIEEIGLLCQEYGAIFHSDTVQTIGHYRHNLEALKTHFIVGSAHKFHGPKGVGFIYINHNVKIPPFIHGGAQERNMRGGTENIYGIVGLAKALELAYSGMEDHRKHIEALKRTMIQKLREEIPGVDFNGESANLDKSLYTVLNVCLPPTEDNDMLLFNLDINEISASGGSACSSGSNIGSHVLAELGHDPEKGAVRFSFSKFNTQDEIDYVVQSLSEMYKVKN